MIVAKQLRIYGIVQGVFYRESMRQAAEQLGVTGWVRNRTDGTVEAFVQGDTEDIEDLLAWARTGPPRARVENVVIEVASPDAKFQTFERRETI